MDNEDRPDFEPDQNLEEFVSNLPPGLLPDGPQIDSKATEEPEPIAPLQDEFPDKMHEDLLGLTWVGFLEKKFRYARHDFVIRTITVGEELLIAQIVKDFDETLGSAKAYAAGIVAACIETVDGEQLVQPLGPNAKTGLRDKFEFITDPDNGWYWPTVEAVFDHYTELQMRQAAVLMRLESKSQASRPQQ